MSSINKLFEACRGARREEISQILQSLGGKDLKSIWESRQKSKMPGHTFCSFTLLIEAAGMGLTEIVEQFLVNGAPIDGRGEYDYTPLMMAGRYGRQEVCRLLVQHGANLNLQDAVGCSALHLVAWKGHQECLAILLQHPSVDLNLKTNADRTALHVAKEHRHKRIIEMLEEAQARHQTTEESKQSVNELAQTKEVRNETQTKLEEHEDTTKESKQPLDGLAQMKEVRNETQAKLDEHKDVQITRQTNEEGMQKMLESSELDILAQWLESVGLSRYYQGFVDAGVTNLADLQDMDDNILIDKVGMKSLHANKFKRVHSEMLGASKMQDGNLVFLSHFKKEAGVDARLVKTQLILHFQRAGNIIPDDSFFLDSDNLHDLSALRAQVTKSAIFLFFITSGVFTRPWCLVELVTAIDYGCRIVPIQLKDSKFVFDFEMGSTFTNDFRASFLSFPEKTETDLQTCLNILEGCGIDIQKVQDSISHLLGLIAKPLHLSSMSQAVLSAEIGDIVKLMNVEF